MADSSSQTFTTRHGVQADWAKFIAVAQELKVNQLSSNPARSVSPVPSFTFLFKVGMISDPATTGGQWPASYFWSAHTDCDSNFSTGYKGTALVPKCIINTRGVFLRSCRIGQWKFAENRLNVYSGFMCSHHYWACAVLHVTLFRQPPNSVSSSVLSQYSFSSSGLPQGPLYWYQNYRLYPDKKMFNAGTTTATKKNSLMSN